MARETVRESARPERTVYGLTSPGRAELHDWMRELLSTPVKEYSQFEAALSLMPVLPPGEAATLLRDRAQRLEAEIRQLREDMRAAARQGVERLFLVETEFLVAMRTGERTWVAQLLGLIDADPDFTRTWKAWHKKRHDGAGPRAGATASPELRRKPTRR